jgi:hypothetical protein
MKERLLQQEEANHLLNGEFDTAKSNESKQSKQAMTNLMPAKVNGGGPLILA